MDFSAVNTVWVLVGAALVFFMQAGFCILESGLTRAKNAGTEDNTTIVFPVFSETG